MNGEIGHIVNVDLTKQEVVIDYGKSMIALNFKMLDCIKHGWSLSIYKLQGSGFDCVISIADKSHTYQLNANLLYTVLTRSKKMHYMLCQARVINSAIKKVESQARNTFLPELLENIS